MYKFSYFIAEKLINYISANYPKYLVEHPRFTVSNLGGEVYSFLTVFIIVVIIPLNIYIIFKLYERRSNHTRYMNYIDNKKRNSLKNSPILTRKSILIFSILFILIIAPFSLQFISGYKNQEFPNGFNMDELAYNPGNQPITDEIVQAMNKNIIPEVIKTGEAIIEETNNRSFTSDLIKEVTGVDANGIINEFDK